MWEPDGSMVIYQGSNLILRLFEVYCGCILVMCLRSNLDFKIKEYLKILMLVADTLSLSTLLPFHITQRNNLEAASCILDEFLSLYFM